MLVELANDFIERVVTFSCQLAKHRGSSVLEAKDVQLHLGAGPPGGDPRVVCLTARAERNWGIRVPGTKADGRVLRSGKPSEAHKTRGAAVEKETAKRRRRAGAADE